MAPMRSPIPLTACRARVLTRNDHTPSAITILDGRNAMPPVSAGFTACAAGKISAHTKSAIMRLRILLPLLSGLEVEGEDTVAVHATIDSWHRMILETSKQRLRYELNTTAHLERT